MKTIILYATRYGSTDKVARLIQEKIPGETKTVNLTKEQVPDLSSFDTVVIGSPIYVGKTLKPLIAYMQQNLEVLKKKRLALFLCAGEQDPTQIEKMITANFPSELCSQAIYKGAMGSELKLENVGFFMRFMLKNFIKVKEDYSRLSDENIDALVKAVIG